MKSAVQGAIPRYILVLYLLSGTSRAVGNDQGARSRHGACSVKQDLFDKADGSRRVIEMAAYLETPFQTRQSAIGQLPT